MNGDVDLPAEISRLRVADRAHSGILVLACRHMELAQLQAWEMVAGIRDRSFTTTELLEAHLRQIKRWNSILNAFVCIDEERARLQANAADDAVKTGRPLGPLHGVPLTIKSSIDV